MIHPHTRVQSVSDRIGCGVFATAFIPRGTLVVVPDPLDQRLSKHDFSQLPAVLSSHLETYLYRNRENQYVLSWDHAKYMNHSCNSNTMMTAYRVEIAVRDIHAGEEITSEYGLLKVEEPYALDCECPNCRQQLRHDDIQHFATQWDQIIKSSLLCMSQVEQPLSVLLGPATRAVLEQLLQQPESYRSVLTLLSSNSEKQSQSL